MQQMSLQSVKKLLRHFNLCLVVGVDGKPLRFRFRFQIHHLCLCCILWKLYFHLCQSGPPHQQQTARSYKWKDSNTLIRQKHTTIPLPSFTFKKFPHIPAVAAASTESCAWPLSLSAQTHDWSTWLAQGWITVWLACSHHPVPADSWVHRWLHTLL